jgi:hypothetical protein
MKLLLNNVVSISLLLATSLMVQAKEWRGIVPLHSTRADVERLLGPSDGKHLGVYKLKDEVVSIQYSEGPCGEGSIWNIPHNTVVDIVVAPRALQQFSDLKIDKSIYKKNLDSHFPDIAYYTNEEEGVTIAVNVIGVVMYVSYGPAAQDKTPRCRKG